MSTVKKSIGDLQAEIEAAVQRIGQVRLPAGLEGLRHLAPPKGMTVRTSLRYAYDGRRIKRNADVSYFDPAECEVVLDYEADEDDASSKSGGLTSSSNSNEEDRIRDLLVAIEAAERDKRFASFVALKNFRDKYLTDRRLAWAEDPAARHAVLAKAIEDKLVLKSQVANPNAPMFPVTAIRLNRANLQVQELLNAAAAARSPFAPVSIRGEPLSATVIRERR